MTKDTFKRYGWISLITFSLMYNMVYLGRFSVTHNIETFQMELDLTDQQQKLILLSVFASYAVGSLISGFLVDRWDAKRAIVCGGTLTSLFSILILYSANWQMLLILTICNGMAQSIIWLGGMNLISQWFREEEWGASVGFANFFSGLSHTSSFLLPAAVGAVLPGAGWRAQVIVPILMLMLFVILFGTVSRSTPQSVGLEPYSFSDGSRKINERFLGRNRWQFHNLILYLFRTKYFIWWCLLAFISSICRYGLFEWIPVWFAEEEHTPFMSTYYEQIVLPLGMAFGTLIITWLAGSKYLHNLGIIITAMAALCGGMVIVFPMVGSVQSVMIGIFISGFALYGINGTLWLKAIDQGGRVFPATIAGILNGCAYLGATVQDPLYSAIVKVFHSYLSVSIATEMLCIAMVLCAVQICKNETIIDAIEVDRDPKIV